MSVENVNVDQGLRRFQPKPCRSCHAMSKKKCMFCGQSWNMRKMDMSDMEIIAYAAWAESIERLRKWYNTMVACRMKSTGSPAVDKMVLDNIGDWRNLI